MRKRRVLAVVAAVMISAVGGGLVPARPSVAFDFPPNGNAQEVLLSISGDGRYVLTDTVFGTNPTVFSHLTDRLTGEQVATGNTVQISDDGSAYLTQIGGWLDRRTGRSLAPPVDRLRVSVESIVRTTGRLVPPKLMSNDGRYVILSTGEPFQAWRWDTATGDVALVGDDAEAVTISGDGRYVVISQGLDCGPISATCGAPVIVDMVTGRRQSLLGAMYMVAALSDDGRYVLGIIDVVDANGQNPVRYGRLDRTTNTVLPLGRWQGDLQMSNDGTVVKAGSRSAPTYCVLPDGDTLEASRPDRASDVLLTGDGSELVYTQTKDTAQPGFAPQELVSIAVRPGMQRVRADESVPLTIAGRFGVPADAAAVALNVTAVGMTASGFVTVYPCGGTVPLASNLNHETGETVPNAVVAKLDGQGRVCLYTKAGGDLVVDVVGYFPAGTPLDALAPVRLLDTREALGAPTTAPLDAGSVVRVQVTGNAGIAAGATTAVLNLTATSAAAAGFVTVFPCGDTVPTVSNLNYERGQTVANAVVARLDGTGGTCLFTKSSTHLVVDVNGTAAGGGTLAGIEPLRLLDTRDGGTPVAAGDALRVRVGGRGGVPADATAAVLNVTATDPAADGFLTVYPCSATPPTASTVNYVRSRTVANLALARLSADGDVCIFTKATTHVVVDVGGAATGTSGYVAIDPVRALDTRNLP